MLQTARPRQYRLYGEDFGQFDPDLIHIETISSRASLHNWAIERHVHPGITQILFLQGGKAHLEAGSGAIELALPSLLLIPSGWVHGFQFCHETKGWVLSIADSILESSATTSLAQQDDLGAMLLDLAAQPRRAELVVALLQEIEILCNEPAHQIINRLKAALGMLLSLFELDCGLDGAEHSLPLNSQVKTLRRFLRLLEAHHCEWWTVADYADELGISQPTLTRICRQTAGKSPGKLIIERRIIEAKRALTSSDASINQIANDLGFSDPAYFARVFRQLVGTTATAFREHRQSDANAPLPMKAEFWITDEPGVFSRRFPRA